MAKIYTSDEDERIIESIKGKGLLAVTKPKWVVLRLALAYSIKNPVEPEPELDQVKGRTGGAEYSYEQVTGMGQEKDYTDVYCAMLSVYHKRDLFSEVETFRKLLQRHIRRGLREFRTSWRESHDFHEYLYQEFLSDTVLDQEADENTATVDLESALKEIGVSGKIESSLNGPRITRYMVHLNHANDLDRLKKGLEKLSFILGLKQMGVFLKFSQTPKLIGIDIPRRHETWNTIQADKIREWCRAEQDHTLLPLCVGVDVEGHPFVFDLVQTPHLFIAGTTGSGKSVCLHSVLLSLLYSNTTESLTLCLIDPKRVEFSNYAKLPNLYGGSVVLEPDEALNILTTLLDEMDRREKILAEQNVRDISEYRNLTGASGEPLPRIVVIIEEVADLMVQEKSIEEPLVRLAQKGRASGIHLILSTQRPDAETFSGLLRSNIPSRIALTVQKSSESKIILDETGAEKLTGKGDMLIKLIGREVTRLHGLNVMPADIQTCLRLIGRP